MRLSVTQTVRQVFKRRRELCVRGKRQEIKSSLHMTQRMGLANADFTAAAAARLENNKQHDCGGKVSDISRKCTQRTKCDS